MSFRSSGLIIFMAGGLSAFAASSVPGIGNFHQVEENVYRGAQPTERGFEFLAKIGVKAVVDLRDNQERTSAEEKEVTALGMRFVSVPMTGLTPPTDAEITRILGLLESGPSEPVFVHCKRGADRTGAVIAAYRIDQDHWDNARALKEAMTSHMSAFQVPRQKFIRDFQSRSSHPDANSDGAANSNGSATH
jgi:tyrosine-protein phosphatase SIW14